MVPGAERAVGGLSERAEPRGDAVVGCKADGGDGDRATAGGWAAASIARGSGWGLRAVRHLWKDLTIGGIGNTRQCHTQAAPRQFWRVREKFLNFF